jgi:hypothetical protein
MNKKLVITLSIIVGVVAIMFIIRGINMSRKAEEPTTAVNTEEPSMEVPTTTEPETTTSYDSNMGLGTDKDPNKVTIPEETQPPTTKEPEKIESFDLTFRAYDKTTVPSVLLDGTSCKAYLSKLKSEDISGWGSNLTESDIKSRTRVLVGAMQNPEDTIKGDLQSVGWLINNLNTLSDNTCIKFTDLRVVGTVPSNKTTLLCMYSWYSVFGMTETLVIFEDCSNSVGKVEDGSTISFSIYKHNARIQTIKGQEVVVVKYYK